MTNVEIAKLLREIAGRDKPPHRQTRRDLNAIADELDPPKPETGTVVWFRTRPDNPWVIGVALPYGITPANNIAACWNLDSDGVEWKPARIIADDEVTIPVEELIDVRKDISNGRYRDVSDWAKYYIDREEALRMERER